MAEHADGVEPVDEVVVYKNRDHSSPVPKMCGRCRHAMGRKRQRRTTRRRSRRRRIKGGSAPFIVDVKKGFELLTDKNMWKIPSKAEMKANNRQVADYKRQYRASGSKDSYDKWVVKKGYAKKAGCSLM